MEHLGTKELITDRLILRKLKIEDAENVFKNWTNDDNVTEYLSWPTHKDIDSTKHVLNNWIKKYENKDFYLWGIVLKDINEPIGTISVVGNSDKEKIVRIGYCIGKKWWKKGITTEAFKRIIEYFFMEVGINRIEAKHVTGNENSGKVMMNCGLKYEGLMKQEHLCNKGLLDTKNYAILKEDYN